MRLNGIFFQCVQLFIPFLLDNDFSVGDHYQHDFLDSATNEFESSAVKKRIDNCSDTGNAVQINVDCK